VKKLGLKTVFAVLCASTLIIACDGGSDDSNPNPGNHYLVVALTDDGTAVAVEGQGTAGATKQFIYFNTTDAESRNVTSISFKFRMEEAAPFEGGMFGVVDGTWTAGWQNLPAGVKTGWQTITQALATSRPADGSNGFGFQIACWADQCNPLPNATEIYIDDFTVTFEGGGTKTYDFEDGVVPAELETRSFNQTGGASQTTAIAEE